MRLTRTERTTHISAVMRLAEYLGQPGITASALARVVGVSHSTIGRWADGSIEPSLSGMRKLHEATGGKVTPNDFLADCLPTPEQAA